jgi:hypothetical protein
MPKAAANFETLVRAVRDRRAILFAGAGLSMAVGLPSWQYLIEHMCEELGLDLGEAPLENVTYHTLAEYYRLKQGSIGPLRSWMDRAWSVPETKVRRSRLHQLVAALDFPIIYTTNYDNNLEVAFKLFGKDYVKITSARDIAQAPDATTQIVKLHGDFEDDASLVIAETDYFNRLNFTSPLDVKFRADALGRTILFTGYSMSDLNIRLLLHRLWESWREAGQEDDRPPSFMFMTSPNAVQEAVLGRWGITMLSGDGKDPEEALTRFLERLAKAAGKECTPQ